MKRKPTRFFVTDSTGKRFDWKFWREGGFWHMEDHEGYVRVFEPRWIDSLPGMQLVIDNYGFTSSLS